MTNDERWGSWVMPMKNEAKYVKGYKTFGKYLLAGGIVLYFVFMGAFMSSCIGNNF